MREKYQRKALKAKHEHMIANPGYQYQPRKPSEKKKRNTKGKLAKIAAKSAKARASASMQDTASDVDDSDILPPPTPVAPLLTFNEDKTMMSFVPGAGPFEQLAAELTEFNNSKWTAAQQAAFALGPIMPPVHSTTKLNRIPAVGADSYSTASNVNMASDSNNMASNVNTNNMASVNGFPSFTSTPNYVPLGSTEARNILSQSAEDFFDEDAERDSSYVLGDLDDYLVDERQDGCVVTGEVFRQFELNEEFQDGLDDFFDFQRFD